MDNVMRKALVFNQCIKNAFLEEENRVDFSKIEFNENNLTEDFKAILLGFYAFYKEFIDKDCDILEFISVLNKLAVQRIFEEYENEETN